MDKPPSGETTEWKSHPMDEPHDGETTEWTNHPMEKCRLLNTNSLLSTNDIQNTNYYHDDNKESKSDVLVDEEFKVSYNF